MLFRGEREKIMKKKFLFVLFFGLGISLFAEVSISFADLTAKIAETWNKTPIDNLSLIVSIIAITVSIRANRYSRLQVSSEYREFILDWYEKCIQIMEKLHTGNYDGKEKQNLIAKLRALSEEGRFIFPNIDKKDGYRENRQIGFKWHDSVERGFLDEFCLQCESPVIDKEKLKTARNNFTSTVFEFLNVERFIKCLNKELQTSYKENKSIEDVEVYDGQF